MFAYLDNVLNSRSDTKLVQLVKDRPTLVDFVNRVRNDYYLVPTKYPRV